MTKETNRPMSNSEWNSLTQVQKAKRFSVAGDPGMVIFVLEEGRKPVDISEGQERQLISEACFNGARKLTTEKGSIVHLSNSSQYFNQYGYKFLSKQPLPDVIKDFRINQKKK